MRPILFLAVALVLAPGSAAATSGWGCYRVNVGPNNPLNVRAAATASSAVVRSVSWADQPIIALRGLARGESVQPDLFDVHQAEMSTCQPSGLPLGARWCPVSIFAGGGSADGWVKRRFVDHSECP